MSVFVSFCFVIYLFININVNISISFEIIKNSSKLIIGDSYLFIKRVKDNFSLFNWEEFLKLNSNINSNLNFRMLDKGLQRNQENIVLEKKSLFPVQMAQNRDLRVEENRILQETQQTVQSNLINSRPQRLSQEYSSSSGVPSQFEKRSNDFKPILREVTSPTASAGASDISYRIVNEILNAESDKRSQMKLKVPTRVVERKKSPMIGHSAVENAPETQQVNISKESKPVFEENTELKHLQEKIAEVNKQLEERKGMLENYKSSLRNESIDLE